MSTDGAFGVGIIPPSLNIALSIASWEYKCIGIPNMSTVTSIASQYLIIEDMRYENIPQTPGIYAIINVLNDKQYIGSTTNLRRRWCEHRSHLRFQRSHNNHLKSAWNKYGGCAFTFRVLENILDAKLLLEREQFWMDSLKPEYNLQPIAERPREGAQCESQSPNHIAKRIATRKAHLEADPVLREKLAEQARRARTFRTYVKGIPRSEETKEKIRAAKLAKPWCPNDKQKAVMVAAMVAGRKGKHLTPEHRAKLSAAAANRPSKPLTPEHRANIGAGNKIAHAAKRAACNANKTEIV